MSNKNKLVGESLHKGLSGFQHLTVQGSALVICYEVLLRSCSVVFKLSVLHSLLIYFRLMRLPTVTVKYFLFVRPVNNLNLIYDSHDTTLPVVIFVCITSQLMQISKTRKT